jgi:hypothetical protein
MGTSVLTTATIAPVLLDLEIRLLLRILRPS